MKNKMKAKEYLQQVEKINKMIDNKLVELEQWKAIATGITAHSDGERVQASGSQQKMADAVSRYVDIQNEVDKQIDRLVELKKEVISTIEQLPSDEYDMLHKMYIGRVDEEGCEIKYMSLEEIADSKKITYKWAATIHGRALQKVQKIIDERVMVS